MATDGVNITEDAEMAECDGDKIVTMMDVLQEQQDFEEDANAVLGASDDKNCTYSKGYIKRQALYACLTCCTEAKVDPTKRAGVCLACSLTCHENHELIELYTKRNFRCDCGNPKFNSHPCQFTPDKTDLNEDNIYNQNFSGLYCICHRPYPDPESTIEDDMIQCIICEDWLHASHLETTVPANDQYSEMVCKSCMEKNEFLHDYTLFAVKVETGDGDIVNGGAKSVDKSLCNGDLEENLVNGIEENKTEIDASSVTINGEVEIDEDKEKGEDKVLDDTDSKKVEESVAVEINEEKTHDNLSNVESTELKPEENEKPDSKDNKMDLDAESKIAELREQSVNITDTNEPIKNDGLAGPDDSNTEKQLKETSDDTLEKQPVGESEAAENTSKVEPDQQNEPSLERTEFIASKTDSTDDKTDSTDDKTDCTDDKTDCTDDKTDSTDDKMENTENEPQKPDDTIKEQTKTQDQIIKKPISEGSDGDNVEDKTDISDKTEQQLLDDLSALTGDNPTSEEMSDTATEEKPVESMEQSECSQENEDVQTNNEEPPKETVNESGNTSEEKPSNETAAGNIEVPDTSQPEKDVKENAEDKTDSVMDAIDELLQTANEVKEKEAKEPTSELTEIKETEEFNDVEMSASEIKLNNEVPEKTENTAEFNDKTSTNNTDVEMTDTTTQNEPGSESKVNDEPTTDSENKDIDDADVSNNTSKTEAKTNDNLENESDISKKSEITDTINESITQENEALNETDNKLETSDENDSTIKDNDEVPNATEIAKDHKRKLSTDLTDDISSKKAKLECVRPKGVQRVHKGATFWPSNFRQKLCTCGECLSMYKDLKVLFLTDLEDTVFFYESLGKENVAGGASQYEKGLQALSSLDRIQQINALTEYNKMRDKLLDFLKSFKDRKEIVKEEDIKAFFAGMKPRREPDGVYFCR